MKRDRTISAKTRTLVYRRAEDRFEYCLDHKVFATSSFHIDHIVALQHSGSNDDDNLALTCGPCNLFKGPNLVTTLPGHDEYVRLFNPRVDSWADHFLVASTGRIESRTAVGAATIKLLRFNTEEQVKSRLRLLELGLF